MRFVSRVFRDLLRFEAARRFDACKVGDRWGKLSRKTRKLMANIDYRRLLVHVVVVVVLSMWK